MKLEKWADVAYGCPLGVHMIFFFIMIQTFRGARLLCWWCIRGLSSMDSSSILDYHQLVMIKIRIEGALVR